MLLALLSVPILKQRLRTRDLVAALVCYSGVLVIATGGNPLGLHFDQPLSLALIAILVGERIQMATIIGLVLIMLGVAVQQRMLRRNEKRRIAIHS